MSIKYRFCLAVLLLTGVCAAARQANPDSASCPICRKWIFRTMIMSGQEMPNIKESISYQFFADFTVVRITATKTEKGRWQAAGGDAPIKVDFGKSHLFARMPDNGNLIIGTDEKSLSRNNNFGITTAFVPAELP